jgi:hypothetical protein
MDFKQTLSKLHQIRLQEETWFRVCIFHCISTEVAQTGVFAGLRSFGFLDTLSRAVAAYFLCTPCPHARLSRLAAKTYERKLAAIFSLIFLFMFYAPLGSKCVAQSGIITTYVGSGLPEIGAMATSQIVDSPIAVAADLAGGFYFSNARQNRIYHVPADGRLLLAAGSGAPGFSGDGGPATSAQLNRPDGIAVDSVGNLYIAEPFNDRIRKVTPGRMIATIAGNGKAGFSGDGGSAVSAKLWNPCSIALDSMGNLFIADTYNLRIRKVTPGGIITTIAGNGELGFGGDGGKAASVKLPVRP